MRDPAEEDAEDRDADERLDDRPGHAERGLLEPELEILESEEEDELAVGEELAQVDPGKPAGRSAVLDPLRARAVLVRGGAGGHLGQRYSLDATLLRADRAKAPLAVPPSGGAGSARVSV